MMRTYGGVLVLLLACQNPDHAATSTEGQVSDAVPSTTAPTLPQSTDSFVVGVVRSDGVLFPVAKYEVGDWSSPWPEPSMDSRSQPPQLAMPKEWYLYEEGRDPVRVQVDELILTDTRCEKVWGFTTDWADKRVRPPYFGGSIVGMVLSERLELVPEYTIPGISSFRERFGLVGSGRTGEGFRDSKSIGYFIVGDTLIGVFLQLLYEGETYEIYEVDVDSGRRLVRVRGGGC